MISFNVLDKEQKEAVTTLHRNVLVSAAPGSGKTTVIIFRLIYLLNQANIDSKNIAVITFTKNAAINMKNRFLKISGGIKTPYFSTFHSFFYKIVKEYYGDINIIDDVFKRKIIINALNKYTFSVNDMKVNEIFSLISCYKSKNLYLSDYVSSHDKQVLMNCYTFYEDYKKREGYLDFDDLEIISEKILSKEDILRHYKEKYSYFIIDEFQDTDSMQVQILSRLNGDKGFIFAVGDEDQSIYSFRGAVPKYMVDFNKIFKDGKIMYLSTNYRCPCNVVSVSSNLIINNICRNEKNIISFNEKKADIKVLYFNNEYAQAEYISKAILEYKNSKDNEFEDFAVLFRTNAENRAIVEYFTIYNIPFCLLNTKYNFYNGIICKDIISYLKLSLNEFDKDSFARIVNKNFNIVDSYVLEKIMKNEYSESPFDYIFNNELISTEKMHYLFILRKKLEKLKHMSINDVMEFILKDLYYQDYLYSFAKKNNLEFTEYIRICIKINDMLIRFPNIDEFLKHVDKVNYVVKKDDNISKDKVILSSIHGAKGMEFNMVFIINCNEGVIPYVKNNIVNIEEERRLFYVGITRTKGDLFICCSGKPSSFINECKLIK